MHVEFRVGQLSSICAFDAENFYRVRDLMMHNTSTQSKGSQEKTPYNNNGEKAAALKDDATLMPPLFPSKESRSGVSSSKSKLTIGGTENFNPHLRVQFILERIVKLESTEMVAETEQNESEKARKANLVNNEFRMKRYKVFPNEVILASLPASTADCVVKIRLIQLPPQPCITSAGTNPLNATDTSQSNKLSNDNALCIGVAKITLRELIMIRSGVRMMLQPKQSNVRAVEELTHDTLTANSMLGKDIGGSASLTFQVLSYTFGNVSHPVLLLYHELQPKASLDEDIESIGCNSNSKYARGTYTSSRFDRSDAANGERRAISPSESLINSTEVPQSACSSNSLCESQHEMYDLHLNSPALRFALVPYVALAIIFLRLHDVILWRKPLETLNMVLLIIFAVYVDMFSVAVLLIFFAYLIIFMKAAANLYHIPIAQLNSGSLVSELLSRETSRSVLYSRRYAFLNALVRAKLFFCQGLQEDSFYELVLAFHIIRNRKVSIVVRGALFCVIMCLISTELLSLLLIIGLFLLYPITFRLPTIRNPKKRRSQSPLSFSDLLNVYRINQPMHISRVVKVIVILPRTRKPLEVLNKDSFNTRALKPSLCSAGRTESGSQVQHVPSLSRQRVDSLVTDFMNAEAVERQQLINAMRLSFALVVISDNDPASDKIFFKLLTHFKNTRLLKDRPIDELAGGAECNEAVFPGSVQSSLLPTTTQNVFDNFFHQTLVLLNYIKKNASLQTYVSPLCASHTGSLVPLELLAHPLWIVEEGRDDGITATIKAMSKPDTIKVGKIGTCQGIDNDARSIALLAAYLIQGFSLTVYSQGEANATCSIIFPLKPSSSRFQAAPRPNPCPPHLFQALEEIWLGGKHFELQKGIPIGIDVVIRIISTYKDKKGERMRNFDVSSLTEHNSGSPPALQSHNFTSRRTNSPKHHVFAANHTPLVAGRSSYGTLPYNQNKNSNPEHEINVKANLLSLSLITPPDNNLDSSAREAR